MAGKTETYKCKRCREPFVARVADRNRGWARFCSKACKAVKQTQQTTRFGPGFYDDAEGYSYRRHLLTVHPFSDEAFEP